MRKAIFLMLLLVSGCALFKWVKIGDSTADGGYNIYADPATVSRSGDLVKMWELNDYKTAQVSAGGSRFLSSRAQIEYDCKESRMRQLFFTQYSENMGEGKIAYVNDSASGNWMPVAPDGIAAKNLKVACAKR